MAAGPRVCTIGVYGWTLATFLAALERSGVGLVVDVRQRRGVRGPEYAWANAARLQEALAGAGLAYEHRRELAPTTELRQLQYGADAREGVGKRSRVVLADEYREGYEREILAHVDLRAFADGLPREHASALLCVERDPHACHRSIVAERLDALGAVVEHLVPG